MYRSPAEQAEFNKRVEDRGGTAAMIASSVERETGIPRYTLPASHPILLNAINERFEYLENQRDAALAQVPVKGKRNRAVHMIDVMER
jgi:hypothetical protein